MNEEIIKMTANESLEATAAAASACGVCGRSAASRLRRGPVSGGCASVPRSAKIMRSILIVVLCALLSGCVSAPSPGLSLKDARVVEGPVLIERSGHVYLRYRRALEERGLTLLSMLYQKKTGDAAYYFFSVPISHPEWGNLIERPLAYDGTEELARKGRVFWLDPDGSKHSIPLKEEPNHSMQRTRASRSARFEFEHHWRLARAADAER